jgi:hypothetical protein
MKNLEFPIAFKKALRLTVGGEEVPRRLRIFKEWWRSELLRVATSTGGRLVDNTDEMVSFFQTHGVERDWFNNFTIGIEEYKKVKRTERFRNLANRRWNKKVSPDRRKKVQIRR